MNTLAQQTTSPISNVSNDDGLISLFISSKKTQSTKDAYRLDVDMFLAFTGNASLRDMKIETLIEFADTVKQSGAAVSTQRRVLSAIKSLFTFGQKIGYLTFNTAMIVELPTAENTLTEKLLSEADTIAMIRLTSKPLARAILTTLYVTGMRVSELCALEWRNLNRDNSTVSWYSEKSKRTIVQKIETAAFWTAIDSLKNAVELRREKSDERTGKDAPQKKRNESHIFVTQQESAVTRQHVTRLVKTAAKRAGLENAGKVSAHWLRHAKASHALENGASIALVSRELGHSSIAVTSMYTHAKPDDSGASYLKL